MYKGLVIKAEFALLLGAQAYGLFELVRFFGS